MGIPLNLRIDRPVSPIDICEHKELYSQIDWTVPDHRNNMSILRLRGVLEMLANG